jgi:hypothetical protein
MDLIESLVQGHGEDVFFGLLQWQEALEIAVDVERVAVSAQREVAKPDVLDGQLSPDPRGLAQSEPVLGVHGGSSVRRQVAEESALRATTAASSSRATSCTAWPERVAASVSAMKAAS